MLTTKKWRGAAAAPPHPPRLGIGGCLGVLLGFLLLWGCSPPGRQSLLLGARLIREGRPADAIAPLQQAVAQLGTNGPASAQAWNYLGLAYHYAGQPNDAAQAYQNALVKDFNLVVVRFNRGCLFLEQGNLPGAINELTTYTTHDPKDALGWLKLGTAQLRARLLDPAERSLQRVLELNPGPALTTEALSNLGMSLAIRRRPADAFKYFNAALRQQTNYTPALLNQAIVAQQQLNDRSLALQRYRAYLDASENPPNFEAVSNLAAQIDAEFRPRVATTNRLLTAVVVTNPPPTPTNDVLGVGGSTLAAATVPPPFSPDAPAAPGTNLVRATPPAGAANTPPSTSGSTTRLGPSPATQPAPPTTQTLPAGREQPSTLAQANPALTVRPEPDPAPEPIPSSKPPTEAPLPPMEVVQLQAEPQVQAAQDLLIPPRTSPPPPPTAPVASSTAAPLPRTEPAPPGPPSTTASTGTDSTADESKPKKKSLLQKLNPLGWFGGKDDKESASEPEPAAAAVAAGQGPPRVSNSPPASAQPVTVLPPPVAPLPPPTPVYPRYTYRRPGAPARGDRPRAEQVLAQGIQAHKDGRLSQATAAYQQAVRADPSFFEAQYNLGVAAFDAASWSDALGAFEQSLVLRPEDTNARLNFALALDRANYPVDAAQELDHLLAIAPDNVDAHATLANLNAQKLSDPAKARLHYTRVLELNPRHPQAAAIRRWLAANQGRP